MAAGATGSAHGDWRFGSGRICLDLMATAEAPAPPGREPLAGPGRLDDWLTGGGLVPPGTSLDGVDSRWVESFTELRDWISQVVRAEIEGLRADSALERVNGLAAVAPPVPCAVRDGRGALVRAFAAPPGRAELLSVVARDAVALLTDPLARAKLRQCEGDRCGRVYLDTSRGRRRRWCSSEVCGNRERVARHRRRAALART
ncbi:CGNR zinc finger domain-containing protein [Streptomyces sp. NPDC057638]|uniref:CGNR zinc finger domain-containing protein n=1 Tax=Streptomyces sp. NPDC057638 TaxID=3346190 RepID=UPI0036AEE2AE